MKYTVSEVYASMTEEKKRKELRTNLIGYYTYRQISFLFTPLFLKLSFSATGVTLLALLFVLVEPLIVLVDSPYVFILLAFADFTFHVLDHVDGNIARFQKAASPLGQYLDSVVGLVHWILLSISIGLLTERQFGVFPWIADNGVLFALIAAIIEVAAQRSRLYARVNFPRHTPDFVAGTRWSQRVKAGFVSSGMLVPIMLCIFGFLEALDLVLLYIVIFSLTSFCYSQFCIIRSLLHANGIHHT